MKVVPANQNDIGSKNAKLGVLPTKQKISVVAKMQLVPANQNAGCRKLQKFGVDSNKTKTRLVAKNCSGSSKTKNGGSNTLPNKMDAVPSKKSKTSVVAKNQTRFSKTRRQW